MSEQNQLTADTEQRLDVTLASIPDIGSRNQAQKVIRKGHAMVNDRVMIRPSYTVTPGAVITWKPLVTEPVEMLPQALPIDIVHEDESLLVINKPAGMPVHPGAGRTTGTLVNALLHHMEGEELPHAPDEPFRPGIVHRLDMDTTGLLVVAKNVASHRALQSQFEVRSVTRQYIGIVWGVPEPRSGTIDAPVGRSRRNRMLMSVRSDGREARTRYETHEILGPASLVRFQLRTGRTHQIRVHLNHIGHPLVGDPAYGGTTIRYGAVTRNRRAFYSNIFEVLDRQALHAQSLGFVHPESGIEMKFAVELPEDMIWTIEQLRKDSACLRDV